jgi:hypothetical protein
VPSRPQVETELAEQTSGVRGAPPAATKAQTPGAEGVLQDLQVSWQALSQQTPSTQKPLPHSASQPQAAPFARWPASLQAPPSRPPSGLLPPPPLGPWQPAIISAAVSAARRRAARFIRSA